MIKNFINSESMKWFRKSFLNKIYNDILTDKKRFCCHVNSWHKLFICWKDLKEVEENQYSNFIKLHYNPSDLICRNTWFYEKSDRIEFLKECISKFETK